MRVRYHTFLFWVSDSESNAHFRANFGRFASLVLFWSKTTLVRNFEFFVNISFLIWKGIKIVSRAVSKKKKNHPSRTNGSGYIVLRRKKSSSKFCDFNFFLSFTVNLKVGLKNQKTTFNQNIFLIIKPKIISVFSLTPRLCAEPYFIKTGNTANWVTLGKKSRFSKLAKFKCLMNY